MPTVDYRLYIDESGDHTYRLLDNDDRRFLGITGVLIRKDVYDPGVVKAVDQLKRTHLSYDPDAPPVLVRSDIVKRKGTFGRFRELPLREAWAADVLAFFRDLQCNVFSVVMDKKTHHERFGAASFDPYRYSLNVLLSRVRGLLQAMSATADVMAESRGKTEDQALRDEYLSFWTHGSGRLTGANVQAVFPIPNLLMRRKDQNVPGLQIADLLAYGLKKEVLERHAKPTGRISTFTRELNAAIAPRINRYGRYLLE